MEICREVNISRVKSCTWSSQGFFMEAGGEDGFERWILEQFASISLLFYFISINIRVFVSYSGGQ